jgi:hypothetical protein
MRYTFGVFSEDAKLPQKFLFFVKVLHELAHLMVFYFNKEKLQLSMGKENLSEAADLTDTPTTIGSIVIKDQVKGDPGIAIEEILFGGRIIPNPNSKFLNYSFDSPLRLQIRSSDPCISK